MSAEKLNVGLQGQELVNFLLSGEEGELGEEEKKERWSTPEARLLTAVGRAQDLLNNLERTLVSLDIARSKGIEIDIENNPKLKSSFDLLRQVNAGSPALSIGAEISEIAKITTPEYRDANAAQEKNQEDTFHKYLRGEWPKGRFVYGRYVQ